MLDIVLEFQTHMLKVSRFKGFKPLAIRLVDLREKFPSLEKVHMCKYSSEENPFNFMHDVVR